jgi:hypothetical protein
MQGRTKDSWLSQTSYVSGGEKVKHGSNSLVPRAHGKLGPYGPITCGDKIVHVPHVKSGVIVNQRMGKQEPCQTV